MNAAFAVPPPSDLLSEELLRNYHRYADYLYRCYMESQAHRVSGAPISVSNSTHPANIPACWKASGVSSSASFHGLALG